jgi:hypothetical protein
MSGHIVYMTAPCPCNRDAALLSEQGIPRDVVCTVAVPNIVPQTCRGMGQESCAPATGVRRNSGGGEEAPWGVGVAIRPPRARVLGRCRTDAEGARSRVTGRMIPETGVKRGLSSGVGGARAVGLLTVGFVVLVATAIGAAVLLPPRQAPRGLR